MQPDLLREPPPERGRYAALIALIGALLVLAVVPIVLLFAGVIRFGRPTAGKVETASVVDENLKPSPPSSVFDAGDERIYCCAAVRAFEDTVVGVRWYRDSRMIASLSGRFGAIARRSTTRFVPAGGRVALYLDRPSDGWQPGSYSVRLTLGARAEGGASFRIVSGGRVEQGNLYRDPNGLFTILVPEGWTRMSLEQASGALVGFTGTGGEEYPPRFAVLSTGLTSATTESLNAELPDTVPQEERFTAITLGSLAGARRTYSWELSEGDEKIQLKSIQVVVRMGNGAVLEINCHSPESRFDADLPTFNAVINSFS